MKNVPNLYIDSDGVIFDFDNHVMSYSGGVHPNKLGDPKLWALVDSIPDFWITMPLLPWGADLVRFARLYDPVILTGCPKTNFDYAADQKKLKYAKHFPGIPVITCLSRDKQNHMKSPGDVLVDDRYKNIKRWNEAGGRGVFFRSYDQTIGELMEIYGV